MSGWQVFLGVRSVDVSDYEILNSYQYLKPGLVAARQRSALYLQPNDQLYFQAAGRAVAIYDYEINMKRVPLPEDAPRGAQACVQTPKQFAQCL